MYYEISTISKAFNIPVSELIRNGLQIIADRHYDRALDKLKATRPDIDKVLEQEQTTNHNG